MQYIVKLEPEQDAKIKYLKGILGTDNITEVVGYLLESVEVPTEIPGK